MNRSISDLERQLAGPETPGLLGGPDLDLIRRLGTRHRRIRRAAQSTAAVLAVVAVTGIGVAVSNVRPTSTDRAPAAVAPTKPALTCRSPDAQPLTRHRKDPRADSGTAHKLSPFAKRVLRAVPCAVQVSSWQVVIPGPGTAPLHEPPPSRVRLVGAPVSLGGHTYAGVTAYARSQFPHWLYDGVERIEREELGTASAHPQGSTDTGILVDLGRAGLACVAWSGGESHQGSSCAPAFVSIGADGPRLQWTMGSDNFLMPGAPMEVFLSEDYSTGQPSTIAIAGLDGTDVASAEFVSTEGTIVTGKVESGTVVPGNTLFHANVPGHLARVIAYDASGNVIENHELKPCSSPADCEVR